MLHKENNVSSAPILGVISRSVGLVVVVMVGLLGCIIIIIADMGWGSQVIQTMTSKGSALLGYVVETSGCFSKNNAWIGHRISSIGSPWVWHPTLIRRDWLGARGEGRVLLTAVLTSSVHRTRDVSTESRKVALSNKNIAVPFLKTISIPLQIFTWTISFLFLEWLPFHPDTYLWGLLGLADLELAFGCLWGLVGAEWTPPDDILWPPGERSLRALALTGVDGGKGDLGETGGWGDSAGDRLTPSVMVDSRRESRKWSRGDSWLLLTVVLFGFVFSSYPPTPENFRMILEHKK